MAEFKATQDSTSKSENYKIFSGCLANCAQKLFALDMSSDINKLKIIMSFIEHTIDLLAALEKSQENNEPELVNIKIEKGDLEEMSNTKKEENIPIFEKQYLVPRFKEQNIIPRVAEQNIIPRVAEQNIIPQVAGQNIIPRVSEQNIIPRVAEQNIIPRVAEQNIIPRVAEQNIIPRYAKQNVVPKDSRFDKSPIKASITDNYQKITPQATNQNNMPRPNNGNYQQYTRTVTNFNCVNTIETKYDHRRTSYGRNMEYKETGTQWQYQQYYCSQNQQHIHPQQQQYISQQEQQYVPPQQQYIPQQEQQYVPPQQQYRSPQQQKYVPPQQQQYGSPQQQQYLPPQQQQLQQQVMYNMQPYKMTTMPYHQAPRPSRYYPH